MGLKECKIIYNALSMKRKEKAIKFLKKWIYKKDILTLRKGVRNALRHNGFGEEYFGIGNLDDIYVELIEDTIIKE